MLILFVTVPPFQLPLLPPLILPLYTVILFPDAVIPVTAFPLPPPVKRDWDYHIGQRICGLTHLLSQHAAEPAAGGDIAAVLDCMQKFLIIIVPGIIEKGDHPLQIGPGPENLLGRVPTPAPEISQRHILQTLRTDIPFLRVQKSSAHPTPTRPHHVRQLLPTPPPIHITRV